MGWIRGEQAYIAFDDTIKGLGVRVAPSGSKTFILEYRPGAGGRGVAKRRLTLGRFGPMTAEQAREAALDALARVRLGGDPQAEKGRQRAALTVAGLVEAFIGGHAAKLKSKSVIAYQGALDKLTAAPMGRSQGGKIGPRLGRRPAPQPVRSAICGEPAVERGVENVLKGGSRRPRARWPPQPRAQDRPLPRARPRAIFDRRRARPSRRCPA